MVAECQLPAVGDVCVAAGGRSVVIDRQGGLVGIDAHFFVVDGFDGSGIEYGQQGYGVAACRCLPLAGATIFAIARLAHDGVRPGFQCRNVGRVGGVRCRFAAFDDRINAVERGYCPSISDVVGLSAGGFFFVIDGLCRGRYSLLETDGVFAVFDFAGIEWFEQYQCPFAVRLQIVFLAGVVFRPACVYVGAGFGYLRFVVHLGGVDSLFGYGAIFVFARPFVNVCVAVAAVGFQPFDGFDVGYRAGIVGVGVYLGRFEVAGKHQIDFRFFVFVSQVGCNKYGGAVAVFI